MPSYLQDAVPQQQLAKQLHKKQLLRRTKLLMATWELTDVKTTLRKSFVLRGADPTQYAYAIDDLCDWKPQLVISGNEAEFKYSYNFTKYFENLYEHIYKNAFPDKSEFKSVLYEGYEKILPALKSH